MVKFIVNKLRKYGLYETKFVKWLKLCALRFIGRKMKKYGLPCLEKFNSIMDEANIKYWVDFGTLLGIYRDGKFIDHDFDIDLGMYAKDYNKDIEALLVKNGFKKIRAFYAFGKLSEQTWNWNGVLVDLFLYNEEENGGRIFIYNFYTDGEANNIKIDEKTSKCNNLKAQACYCPKVDVIVKHDFNGINVSMPENTVEYLKMNYGENFMTPDKYWDTSKSTNIEEVEDIVMEEYLYKI